jgi:hypothetical protein
MTAPTRFYVLEHSSCGHFGGLASDRSILEARQRQVAAAGYHRWRVRLLDDHEVDEAIAAVASDAGCETCRMDPSRGSLPAAVAAYKDELAAGNIPHTTIVATRAPPAGVEPEVLIMPGACLNNPDAITAMHKQTHDGIVELTPNVRWRGPVRWEHWHGRTASASALHTFYADDDRPVTPFGLDQFDAFFDEHPDSCVLIIASAEVVR